MRVASEQPTVTTGPWEPGAGTILQLSRLYVNKLTAAPFFLSRRPSGSSCPPASDCPPEGGNGVPVSQGSGSSGGDPGVGPPPFPAKRCHIRPLRARPAITEMAAHQAGACGRRPRPGHRPRSVWLSPGSRENKTSCTGVLSIELVIMVGPWVGVRQLWDKLPGPPRGAPPAQGLGQVPGQCPRHALCSFFGGGG